MIALKLRMKRGRYGQLWNMTEPYREMFLKARILSPATEWDRKVRIPLDPVKIPEVVTVGFKGHRPQKAVVIKRKDAGQRLLVAFPSEADGLMYLQYVDRWELKQ